MNKILALRDLQGSNASTPPPSPGRCGTCSRSPADILPTADVIIEEVGKFYDHRAPPPSGARAAPRPPARARHVAIYLTRHMTNLSLKDIGREFDNRDHTTVLHSIDRVEKQCKSDPETNEIIKDIRSNINERYN